MFPAKPPLNAPPGRSPWLKAAVLGSLWASSEIVLGSFLHNLRVPLAGYMLTAIGICLLVAGNQFWPERGLLWRAGLICAVMKSISPSPSIFGPMTAIFMEGVLLEAGAALLGRNIAGYLVGGGLAMAWGLFQKMAKLLMVYGFNILQLYINLYARLQESLGGQSRGHWTPILVLFSTLFAAGAAAAAAGVFIGRRARRRPGTPDPHPSRNNVEIKSSAGDSRQTFSINRLMLHLVVVLGGMFLLERIPIPASLCFVSAHLILCLLYYESTLHWLKKPRFWMLFISTTMLAALLLDTLGSKSSSLSWSGLGIGLRMNLRAILMVSGFSAIGAELRNPAIKRWLQKRGSEEFFQTLEICFEALPNIIAAFPGGKQILKNPFHTLYEIIRRVDFWLNDFQLRAAQHDKIFIITGAPGTGKSSLLSMVVAELKDAGLVVGGIYAPGEWKNGERCGFDLIDLTTGERTLLCRKDGQDDWPRVGSFRFRPDAIAFGRRALSPPRLQDADLVVIDEVGHWELDGHGWSAELDNLSREGRAMIWVVRRNVVDEACARWLISNPFIWDLGQESADKISADLIKKVLSTQAPAPKTEERAL